MDQNKKKTAWDIVPTPQANPPRAGATESTSKSGWDNIMPKKSNLSPAGSDQKTNTITPKLPDLVAGSGADPSLLTKAATTSPIKKSAALQKFKIAAIKVGQEEVKKRHDEAGDEMMYTFTEALRAAMADGNLKKVKPWYILLPTSIYRRAWEGFITFLLLYTLIVLPVKEVFSTDSSYTTLDMMVDILFCVDILVTFISAYDDQWGDQVVDLNKIAVNYIKRWFFIDAFASFPFALAFPDINYDQWSNVIAVGKTLKVPRLILRLLRLMKLMRAYRFRKLFYELEYSPMVHQGVVRIVKLLLLTLTFGHFSACFWYKAGDLSNQSGTGESWLVLSLSKDVRDDASPGYLYLLSLYWAYQTLTTVGFGDIVGRSEFELVVSIVVMTIGTTIFSYITATVSSIIQASDEISADYRSRMHQVSTFISEKRLPPKIQLQVIREISALYRRVENHSHNWAFLMTEMSPKLQEDIIQHTMKDVIKISSFVRHMNNPKFHTELFAACEEIHLQKGQFLATYGFPNDYWYFVKKGSLAAVSSTNVNVVYRKYIAGQSIGETCVFLSTTWFASIKCLYTASVLRLPINDLLRIAGAHDGATSLLIDLATSDYAKISLAKKNTSSSGGGTGASSPSSAPKQGLSSLSPSPSSMARYRSIGNMTASIQDASAEEISLREALKQSVLAVDDISESTNNESSVDAARLDKLQQMVTQVVQDIEKLSLKINRKPLS